MSFIRTIITVFFLVLIFAQVGFSAVQGTVSFDPSADSRVVGYKLYYGTASGAYDHVVDLGSSTEYVVTGLEEGITYHFAATTYDASGNESGFSEELVSNTPNPAMDSDGDGLTDVDETGIYGTDPYVADTDGDGLADGAEVLHWGDNWSADLDGDGLINLLDEDSDNDGIADGSDSGDEEDPNVGATAQFFETGEATVDSNWRQVSFSRVFNDPVVVAKPMSSSGPDPAVVRIRNVDGTGFELRIQEWDYLDGVHGEETISYIVMERGSHILADGTHVEAGTFSTKRTRFTSVSFEGTFQTVPVMIAAVTSFNEQDAVTGRLKDIDSSRFQFSLQEQEANAKRHKAETISYIAWEPSSGEMDGITFEVGRTENIVDQDFQFVGFTEFYNDPPLFVADMQTANETDAANLRWQYKDVYGIEVKVAEEESDDSEMNHGPEVVGYMVFSR
jgi:hypothetical protein